MASLSHWCRGSWNGLGRWGLSQIVQEDHSGRRLDWSNMTRDRGYWSDAAPNHPKKHSYKNLNKKRLYFSDFKKPKIKVCHPCEMHVVEAQRTQWVTFPTCEISVREERDETWQMGVYRSAVRGWLGYIECYINIAGSTTWHVQDVQGLPQKVPCKSCM